MVTNSRNLRSRDSSTEAQHSLQENSDMNGDVSYFLETLESLSKGVLKRRTSTRSEPFRSWEMVLPAFSGNSLFARVKTLSSTSLVALRYTLS